MREIYVSALRGVKDLTISSGFDPTMEQLWPDFFISLEKPGSLLVQLNGLATGKFANSEFSHG